jgi:hypothetical protein
MSTQGTATVDFGSSGALDASVAVTGQAAILTSNLVEAWLSMAASANNTGDNAFAENLEVRAGNIVAGTGFTIYVKCTFGKAFGQYNINWVWN